MGSGLKLTEEIKIVANEISKRGCYWTDGYENSFAYDMDSIRFFERERKKYLSGAKELREICQKVDINDPVWKILGFYLESEDDKNKIEKCCNGIINVLS